MADIKMLFDEAEEQVQRQVDLTRQVNEELDSTLRLARHASSVAHTEYMDIIDKMQTLVYRCAGEESLEIDNLTFPTTPLPPNMPDLDDPQTKLNEYFLGARPRYDGANGMRKCRPWLTEIMSASTVLGLSWNQTKRVLIDSAEGALKIMLKGLPSRYSLQKAVSCIEERFMKLSYKEASMLEEDAQALYRDETDESTQASYSDEDETVEHAEPAAGPSRRSRRSGQSSPASTGAIPKRRPPK